MKSKKDFERVASDIRALPAKERKGKALQYAREFRVSNPKFDAALFFTACQVSIPVSHLDEYIQTFDCEVDLREVKFTIYYRWNNCDVDAALVPMLSNMCGRVKHEVGKADMLGGGYECGPAEKTPIADTVYALHDWALKVAWPKGVEPTGGYEFVQGYSDMSFKYEGSLAKLQSVVEECKLIVTKLIQKHICYHGKGDIIRNRLVNVWAGTGSNILRIE